MTYYKIICWNECPFCLKAKMEMIDRSLAFEYCSVDHSNQMLDYYKSIYKHETVPMIIQINDSGESKFIGGYTDLIEYFKHNSIEGEIPNTNG